MLIGFVAAALPLYLALQGGGYDVVFRHQVGTAIWWFLALAFAFGVLPIGRPAPEQRLAMAGLAALVGWLALGMIGTESQGRTFGELGRLITYAGVLTLAWSALGPRTWRDAATGLTFAALLVPAIAIASRLAPSLFESVASSQVLYVDRLAYPLGYWNAVASWCAIAFCLGLSWSAHARRSITRELTLAALPVAAVGLYLTYSRAGLAALLLGVAVVVLGSRNRVTAIVHAGASIAAAAVVVLVVRSQPEIADGAGGEGGWLVGTALLLAALACSQVTRLTAGSRLDRRQGPVGAPTVCAVTAIAVAAATAIAIGPGVAVRAEDEFGSGGRPELRDDPAARLAGLEDTRGRIWASALRAFASDPVAGTGAGTFQFWWQRDGADGDSVLNAHSLYLELLAELGVPGLLLMLGLLGAVLLGAVRARRGAETAPEVAATTGLLAAYSVFLFHAGADWLWQFPALVMLALGAGVTAGSARALPRRRGSRLPTPRLAIAGMAVVAGAINVPAAVSTAAGRAAEGALALGQTERADDLAGEAIRAQPWAADPYALRAFIALSAGRPAAAREDLDEAVEREPTNWRHRLLLVRTLSELGQTTAALEAIDEAARLQLGYAEEFAELRRAVATGELSAEPRER